MNGMKRRVTLESREQINLIPGYISVIIMLFVVLIPLLLILIMSISKWSAFSKNIFSFLETGIQWNHFADAWKDGHMARYFKNTVFVLIISLIGINTVASMIAFSIKYYGDKLSNVVYYIVLSAMFIPTQALSYGLFDVFNKMNLLNSLGGLSLAYIGVNLPLATMLYAGFYRSIPNGLIEAASLDGCGVFKVYSNVFVPLSKTIIATVTILSGMSIWKDFFLPMILITSGSKKTIATSMQLFVSEYTMDYSLPCAAMVLQTLPALVVFLILQKQFVEGMTAGAVKG